MTNLEFYIAVAVGGAAFLGLLGYLAYLFITEYAVRDEPYEPRHTGNVWDDGSYAQARRLPRHVDDLFEGRSGFHRVPGEWDGVLAPHIYTGLRDAAPDETCVDYRLNDDAIDAWDNGPAKDDFEGFGDAEGWVKALFAGKVTVPA